VKRRIAETAGRMAEDEAARWLEGQGWQVLDRRRKTPVGEIDLVCRRDGLVAFVEVKWRARKSDLDTAIDAQRLARVAHAADIVGHEYVNVGDDMQVDVILLAPGCAPRHIPNAWQP
jgi:putative endonuclease